MYCDGTILLDNYDTYKRYCEKYNCKNLGELVDLLWLTYGLYVEVTQIVKENISLFEKNL
jgi:hypothetical protein